MKNNNTYFTRLTPNFKNWEKPSGADGKCGLDIESPYEGRYGFGWEEWLFYDVYNPENQHDGYCYGFIQAFHGKNLNSDVIDRLYLYTRVCNGKIKENHYVGYIDNLEILQRPYKDQLLINKMMSFCERANNDLGLLDITGFEQDLQQMCQNHELHNVRFKASNVKFINSKDYSIGFPIKLQRGQFRFALYSIDEHPNFLTEINKY